MRSIIASVVAFSSVLFGTVAVAQAQEIPETFLAVGHRLKESALQSRDYFNQDASGQYINRIPNCTVLGQQIDPCE